MPYLYNSYQGDNMTAEATSKPPFGPGFTDEQAMQAERMEVWATTFSDSDEYVEFRLLKDDQVIHSRRIGDLLRSICYRVFA